MAQAMISGKPDIMIRLTWDEAAKLRSLLYKHEGGVDMIGPPKLVQILDELMSQVPPSMVPERRDSVGEGGIG